MLSRLCEWLLLNMGKSKFTERLILCGNLPFKETFPGKFNFVHDNQQGTLATSPWIRLQYYKYS